VIRSFGKGRRVVAISSRTLVAGLLTAFTY